MPKLPKTPRFLRLAYKQSRQKLRKWLQYDPEYEHYLPKHHLDYRGVAPGSQPDAHVPKIRDIDQYYHTYVDRDQTYNEDAWRRNFEVYYRFQMLENPVKMLPGQTVGPFYDMGRPDERTPNADRPQVYAYRRKPVNRPLQKHVESIKSQATEARDRIQKELMKEATEKQESLLKSEREQAKEQRETVRQKRRQRRKSRVLVAEQPDVAQVFRLSQKTQQEGV